MEKENTPWFISSSGSGLSLTLGGFAIGGLIPLIAVLARIIGIELSELELITLFDVIVASVSSVMIAVGAIRKIYYKMRK